MAHNDTLSQYLASFTAETPVLNQGLSAGELFPRAAQPGIFEVGLEALYADELSVYDAPKLSAPATFLSGLEAAPVVALDTGKELTLKAVQIFLNMSRYKGADRKPLLEDGTWGKNSQFALAAWQQANAGKSGISDLQIDARKGRVWMPSNLAGEMRAKIAVTPRGAKELALTDGARGPAKPTAADASVFETAASVRSILRSLDVPVSPRGKADAELVQGWQRAANVFRLNPSVSAEPGADKLFVDANTLSVLRVKARANRPGSDKIAAPTRRLPGTRTAKTFSPATSTGKTVSSSGTMPVQTSEVQRVLRSLGWTKSVQADGKFGPKTQKAWQSSAARRGLDATIKGQPGAGLTYVSSATLARLQEDAAKGASKGSSTEIQTVKAAPVAVAPAYSPMPIPASTLAPSEPRVEPRALKSEETPPRSGLAKVQVGTVQDVLLKLKFQVGKTGRDGLWGKATKAAWEKAAKNRGLDALIAKASPTEAWVSPQTLEQLSAESGGVKKPGEASPQPSAGDSDLVAVETKSIGPVLRAFGKPMPKSAAALLTAWKQIAKSEKQDDRATTKLVAGALVLYAPKSAADAIVNEANLRIDVAKLIAASNTPVLMPTVQDAIAFWSNQEPTKAKFGAAYTPKSRTAWDANTGVWMLRYLNIPRENIRMWERALPLLVAADQKSVKLPASFVPAFGTDATNYKGVKKVIAKRDKGEAQEKKLQALINAQVKASSVIASVMTIQQALNELYKKQQAGLIPKSLPLSPVPRTGKWDGATYRAFLAGYGNAMLGKVPPGLINDLLDRLLVMTPALSGFGEVFVGEGRTYMRVTPENAKLIAEDAKSWSKRTKEVLTPLVVLGKTDTAKGTKARADVMRRKDTRSSSSSDTRSADTRSSDTRSSDTRSNITNVTNERNITNERNVTNESASQVEQPSPAGPEPVGPAPVAPVEPPEPSPELLPAPAPAQASSPSGFLWMLGALGALGIGVAMSDKNKRVVKP